LVSTNPVRLNLLAEPEQEIHEIIPETEPMKIPISLDPTKIKEEKGAKLEILDNSLPSGLNVQERSSSIQREVTFDKDSRIENYQDQPLKPTETPDWENSKFEIKSPNNLNADNQAYRNTPGTAEVEKMLKFEEERPPSFSDNQVSSMRINKAPVTSAFLQPSKLDTKVFEFESNQNKQRFPTKMLLSSSSAREEAGFSPIRDETQTYQFRDSRSMERLQHLEQLHGKHKAGQVFPSYDSLAAPAPQSVVLGFGADYSNFEMSETRTQPSKPAISRLAL
jgi:hypothetical protein